jgi:2-methylisocitrate lyase-like PEP mutase family enzyme
MPVAETIGRLGAAPDARRDADVVIIARTDARSTERPETAMARGGAYWEAGAGVIFVESPESEAECG